MDYDAMTKNKQVLRIRETIPGEKVREGIDALVDGLLERVDFRLDHAAIDEIMDFGRPRSITLAVLIDRGHRELPIAADVAAIRIQTKRAESVILRLEETDKKEEIVICETMPL